MKSIKLKLPVILMLSLVISLGISFVVYIFVVNVQVQRLFINDSFENNNKIASSLSTQLNTTIDEQIQTLIGIEVAHHNITVPDVIFNTSYYETILNQNEYINSIEILSKSGVVLYSSSDNDNRTGISLAQYDLVEQSTVLHEVSIGGLIYDSAFEELAIEVIYNGEDVFVLGKISIEFLSQFGEDFKVSFPRKEIMILDQRGVYLFDSKNDLHLIQYREPNLEYLIANQIEGDINGLKEIDGIESVVSTQTFGSEDWYLIIYEDLDSALLLDSISSNYYTFSILAIGSIFIISLLIIDFFVVKELSLLRRVFRQFGNGSFQEKLKESRIYEVDSIRNSINEMGDSLDEFTNKLTYLAFHDSLTGLKSKNKAKEEYSEFLKGVKSKYAFVYMDIERFRVINENYGYDIGDDCLVQVSSILKSTFKHVYRIESDEFLILLEFAYFEALEKKLDELNNTLSSGLIVGDIVYGVSMKAGISLSAKKHKGFDIMLKRSILALDDAKLNGNKLFSIYDDTKNEYYYRKSRIEFLLIKAIEDGEFTTVYQPIIDMEDRSIRGFEALSRWYNEELGHVSPSEFVPILEQSKRINLLDDIVLNNALKMNKALCDKYNSNYVLSINISVETLMNERFIQTIDEALERYSYDPQLLELEITESAIISDFSQVTEKMNYLKEKGVKFSEDDFGDGYSSLTYLSRLNINTLKISRSFLSSILVNVRNKILIQTILDLSNKLGFQTIVEGIEDLETFEIFKEYGCKYAQGYLFYRPIAEDKLLELIEEKQSESKVK